MAKAKSKKITLEKVLVPLEEQPYEVPENWCSTKIGVLVDLHRGVSYKKTDAHDVRKEGECLILRGGNIGEGYIDTENDNIYVSKELVNENQFVRKNDIIIVASTGSVKVIGRAGVSQYDYDDVAFGAFLMLIRPKEMINSRYIDYYFQGNEYRNRIRGLASGVNINNIKTEYIMDTIIPFPTLAEQQRIVEQIERLFAKLDEASEKAEIALNNSYDRKNAILELAYSGKLTQKWRKNNHYINNVLDEIRKYSLTLAKKEQRNIEKCQKTIEEIVLEDGTVWHETQIGSVGVVTNGSTPSRKCDEYWNGNIPWVSSGEVRNNIISYTREQITELGFVNSSVKKLPKGTVLIAMIGEGKTRGQSSVLDIEATTNQNVAAIVIEHGYINPKFLWYWLQKEYKKNREKGAGSGPQALNCQRVRELKFIVPSIEEQNEIVNVLERLMEQEEQATLSIERVLEQVVNIKKSILSKAFRGELGTNNLKEESSIELLKRIIEDN